MNKLAFALGALGCLFFGSLLASPIEDQEYSWYVKRGFSVVECKEEGLFGASWGLGLRQEEIEGRYPLLLELDIMEQADRSVNSRACFLKFATYKHLPKAFNHLYIGAGISIGAHEKDSTLPMSDIEAEIVHNFYSQGPQEMVKERVKLISVDSARWEKTRQVGFFGEGLIGFEWNIYLSKVTSVWDNQGPKSTQVPMRMFIEASVHQPAFMFQKHFSYRPHVQVDMGIGF